MQEYDPLHVIDGENKASAARKRAPCATGGNEENSFEEMTINEIMNGKGDHYPGLIPLVYAYLDLINCDSLTMERVGAYLEMIKKRSTGELMTPAAWMRKYVRDHPAYKKDSVVSEEICFDLLTACKEIGEGTRECPEILGNVKVSAPSAERSGKGWGWGGLPPSTKLFPHLKNLNSLRSPENKLTRILHFPHPRLSK